MKQHPVSCGPVPGSACGFRLETPCQVQRGPEELLVGAGGLVEKEAASEGVTKEVLGVEAALYGIEVCTCQNPQVI